MEALQGIRKTYLSGVLFCFLPRLCVVLGEGQPLPSSCNSCMCFLTSASVRGLSGEPLYERKEYLIVS